MSRSIYKPAYGVTPHGNRENQHGTSLRTKKEAIAFVDGYVRKRNKGYVCWIEGKEKEWYWRTELEFMQQSQGVVGKRLEPRAYMVERMKLGEIIPVFIRKSVASYRFG